MKQDGRLPPAYFSHEYKLFDQHLPTVKNETAVQNLVYEGFLQTSIPPLISIFYAKEGVSRFSVEEFSVSQDRNEKLCKGTLLFSRKFLVSKKYYGWEGGITFFRRKYFVSQCRKISWGNLLMFH